MLPQPIKLFSKFNEVRNISWTLVLLNKSKYSICRYSKVRIFSSQNSCHPISFREEWKRISLEKLNLFWQASQEFLVVLNRRKKGESTGNGTSNFTKRSNCFDTIFLVQELKPRSSHTENIFRSPFSKCSVFVRKETPIETHTTLFSPIPLLRFQEKEGSIQITSIFFAGKGGSGGNLG